MRDGHDRAARIRRRAALVVLLGAIAIGAGITMIGSTVVTVPADPAALASTERNDQGQGLETSAASRHQVGSSDYGEVITDAALQPASLEGIVVDADGNLVEGATVTVLSVSQNEFRTTGESHSDGSFALHGMTAGMSMLVRGTSDWCDGVWERRVVMVGGVNRATIQLGRRRAGIAVHGLVRLRHLGSRPIECRITVASANGVARAKEVAEVDWSGCDAAFQFNDLPAGRYTIVVNTRPSWPLFPPEQASEGGGSVVFECNNSSVARTVWFCAMDAQIGIEINGLEFVEGAYDPDSERLSNVKAAFSSGSCIPLVWVVPEPTWMWGVFRRGYQAVWGTGLDAVGDRVIVKMRQGWAVSLRVSNKTQGGRAKPLAGAYLVADGKLVGVVDDNGAVRLELQERPRRVIVSAVGMPEFEIPEATLDERVPIIQVSIPGEG